MASDMFLKLDGVDGESSDHKHAKWIEIQSFSWGISQAGAVGASSHGSLTSQRADIHDFNFTKHLDSSTSKLQLMCLGGDHLPSATLELCRAGGEKELYMSYKFTDVLVALYQLGGHGGGDLPTENIGFRFGKVEWKYIPTKVAGGKGAGNIPGGWDLKTNKKV